jgi:predicted anti-sigma-YlaC factor YlaD
VSVRDPAIITCREVVEIVGDYLGGVLEPADHARFEQHLHACTWCMDYLDNLRDTIELTGQLGTPAPVEPGVKQALLESFRRWKDRK